MTNHISLATFITVLLLASLAFTQEARASSMLHVEATQTTVKDQPAIKFIVENISDSSVELYSADLPWANRYSVVVLAVTKNGAEILSPSVPIDDAGPGATTIKPGQKVQGSVRVSYFVNGLKEAREKNDVLIFWFYEPKDIKQRKLGEFGGWLLLSKTRGHRS